MTHAIHQLVSMGTRFPTSTLKFSNAGPKIIEHIKEMPAGQSQGHLIQEAITQLLQKQMGSDQGGRSPPAD